MADRDHEARYETARRRAGGRVLVRLLIAAAALVVAAVAVAGWLFFARPLTVDAWLSRRALGHAGLARHAVAITAGRLVYWEGGAGTPLVLLHGAGDQAGAWAKVAPALVGRHRLLVPDLPGHGGSDPGDGPIGVGEIRAGVEAVLEAGCGGKRAVLVGNSLGAWVAMLAAIDHPEWVAGVVAVNGGPLRGHNPTVNILPRTRDQALRTMDALTGPDAPRVPGFVLDDVVRQAKTGPLARLAATADEMEGYLLDGRLGELAPPVALVWGDADELMTLEYARRMLAELPEARLHLVRGCGHVPQRECPERFLDALRAALADLEGMEERR